MRDGHRPFMRVLLDQDDAVSRVRVEAVAARLCDELVFAATTNAEAAAAKGVARPRIVVSKYVAEERTILKSGVWVDDEETAHCAVRYAGRAFVPEIHWDTHVEYV